MSELFALAVRAAHEVLAAYQECPAGVDVQNVEAAMQIVALESSTSQFESVDDFRSVRQHQTHTHNTPQ